jgi:hypothetical protein
MADPLRPEAGVYSINATGVQVTSSNTSAVVAIPTDASGNTARFVRILTTGLAYVRPGFSGTICTVNDILCNSNFDLVLCVRGFTHMAYLQEGPASKINITPVEV